MTSAVENQYGWPSIPSEAAGLPVVLLDLDGTLRGEALPMVKLALPYVPDFIGKITLREPLRMRKALQLGWNLSKLWTLRNLHREQRRRYKRLFSELHHLSAALLSDIEVKVVRQMFSDRVNQLNYLWFDRAVRLLDELTQSFVVVLVTGSEQIQTEQCVSLLTDYGVKTERLLVCGSLYAVHEGRFTGQARHLNVTLDGKRDVAMRFANSRSIWMAFGNSRPDRALFEAVDDAGLNVLVCPTSVLQKRNRGTFVVRKMERSGFVVCWNGSDYLDLHENYINRDPSQPVPRPILATDRNYSAILDEHCIRRQYFSIQV